MAAERLLFTAIAAIVAIAPARAGAWCQMTTSSERPPPDSCLFADPPNSYPLAWRHRCTSVSLSTLASSSLSDDQVRTILRRSIDTWEMVECPSGGTTGLHVEILAQANACTEATHHTDGPNVHSIIFVDEGWTDERMHAPEAFAVTLVWHDPNSGEIWDVDIEINEELAHLDPGTVYGDCSGMELCPTGVVDLQNVLTHEMGHYFGLAHTPNDTLATMYAQAAENETLKRTLEADDIEGLCTIYPAGSLPEECDVTPRGGLGLDCSDGGCGCRVAGRGRDRAQPVIVIAGIVGLAVVLRRTRRR